MLNQKLSDIQKEIHRLFVAGSKLNKGDTQLSKHLPFLIKMGDKTPVIKQLADKIESLIHATPKKSASQLIEVSSLLYAILYTQGTAYDILNLPLSQVPTMDIDEVSTIIPYSDLVPTIECFAQDRCDKYNSILQAYHEGLLSDFRLFPYLDRALGDKNPDIAYYMESTVIPSLGAPILPTLLASFSIEDSQEQVRRLRCIQHLGYDKIDSLTDLIFKSTCQDLQAVAISSLGDSAKNTDRLIGMLSETNEVKLKEVYRALVSIHTEKSLSVVVDIYLNNKSKQRLIILSSVLSQSSFPYCFEQVFAKAKEALENIRRIGTNKLRNKTIDLSSFTYMILVLQQSKQRVLFDFFHDILSDKTLYAIKQQHRPSIDIFEAIASTLKSFPREEQLEFYNEATQLNIIDQEWVKQIWQNLLTLCIQAYNTPEYKSFMYTTFRDAFCMKYIDFSHLSAYFFTSPSLEFARHSDTFNYSNIDQRWGKLLLMQNKSFMPWENDYVADIFYFLSTFVPSLELRDVLVSNYLGRYSETDKRSYELLQCINNIDRPFVNKEQV